MSNIALKKVILVIGDENYKGLEPITNIPFDSSCKLLTLKTTEDSDGNKDFSIEKKDIKNVENPFSISLGLFKYLKDQGFYIVEIGREFIDEISSFHGKRNFELNSEGLKDGILKLLIGDKINSYRDGIIYKIKECLFKEDPNSNIKELPEISAVLYSGFIRDSISEDISSYKDNIKYFIDNLSVFLPILGLNSSFVFVDNVPNYQTELTLTEEESIAFKSYRVLRRFQKELHEDKNGLSAKYFAVDSVNVIPELIKKDLEIEINEKKYTNFIGYISSNGKTILEEGNSGFLYNNSNIEEIAELISDLFFNEIFQFGSSLKGLEIQWFNYSEDFKYAYLFNKGIGTLSLNDLIDFNPDPQEGEFSYNLSKTEDEDNLLKSKKGNTVVYNTNNSNKSLEKENNRVFTGKINNRIKFSHIIFYNEYNNHEQGKVVKSLSAVVKMKSTQEFFEGESIKLNIRRTISGAEIIDIIKFPKNYVEYEDHSKLKYDFVDVSSNKELGLISALKSDNEANITEDRNRNITLESERSNRLTLDRSLSGDSLFIDQNNKLYRDRDNSYYCPYFNLPQINKFENEVNFEENSNNLKMFFDARFGLMFWRLLETNNESFIVTYFTTGYQKDKKFKKFPIVFIGEELLEFKKEYKNIIDKIRISIACDDLIINFNGKVYKSQEEKDGFVFGEIYSKNNGYIIFPAWYDLWNISYIIKENNVSFLDCSGEEHSLNYYKDLESLAYIENFPGPKNLDYKNIISNYLLGGLTLKELILQGFKKEYISIYDSSVISDTNEYKIDIYPLSYKYPSKISLKKKRYLDEENNSLLSNIFISNEGFGVKACFSGENKWYYNYFTHDLNKRKTVGFYNFNYNKEIEKSENSIKILSSRGVRVSLYYNKEDKTFNLTLI